MYIHMILILISHAAPDCYKYMQMPKMVPNPPTEP